MSKNTRPKRIFKVKVSTQTPQNVALENVARLWKLTEQAEQKPLTLDEQKIVERMRELLRLLFDDMTQGINRPLTIEQTQHIAQEMEALLQQAPFEK